MSDLEEMFKCGKIFTGECLGVALSPKSPNNKHVGFIFLVQKIDRVDRWEVLQDFVDVYWLPELTRLLTDAQSWIEANCTKDPSGYGYLFKE